ncbi:hypothetical protein ACFL6G_08020 [candidate division KSB1 bacterium]
MSDRIKAGPLLILCIIMFFGIRSYFCSGKSILTPPERRVNVENYTFITESGENLNISDFRGKMLVLETGACTSGG